MTLWDSTNFSVHIADTLEAPANLMVHGGCWICFSQTGLPIGMPKAAITKGMLPVSLCCMLVMQEVSICRGKLHEQSWQPAISELANMQSQSLLVQLPSGVVKFLHDQLNETIPSYDNPGALPWHSSPLQACSHQCAADCANAVHSMLPGRSWGWTHESSRSRLFNSCRAHQLARA